MFMSQKATIRVPIGVEEALMRERNPVWITATKTVPGGQVGAWGGAVVVPRVGTGPSAPSA